MCHQKCKIMGGGKNIKLWNVFTLKLLSKETITYIKCTVITKKKLI